MYKIFTLAVAVSVLPVSKQYYSSSFNTDKAVEKSLEAFIQKKIKTNFIA
jgi:hypothetical protein